MRHVTSVLPVILASLASLASGLAAGCKGYSAVDFDKPLKLGGKNIEADQLNSGRDGYMPPELITVGFGPGGFGTRELVLAGVRDFAASGAKLTRLVFPRTEFQAYGSTVILYTSYETDVTKDGRTRTERGLATEVFVQQDGRWLNTAWQLSPTSNQ